MKEPKIRMPSTEQVDLLAGVPSHTICSMVDKCHKGKYCYFATLKKYIVRSMCPYAKDEWYE